ncbi:unnamed protein product [Lupinus luteus]|uniref:Peptidase A1 domain-containing protein n=1 Tax=Lupinus luteus TaxID=3873 RepID=A0AAV1WZK2_LUPLU
MVVEVSIGTFHKGANKSYLLKMSTTSDFTWTQYEDCRTFDNGHCYPLKNGDFPNHHSLSNHIIFPLTSYSMKYHDCSNSSGYLIKDTFTFRSTPSPSKHLEFPNITFGCGCKNHDPLAKDKSYQIAGVFGLGIGERSFTNQIQNQSEGKFSYCLVHVFMKNPPPLYLRFGTDIKPPSSSQTIKFLESSTHAYIVDLVDLGVNKEQLHIHNRQINSPSLKFKGIVFDSGTIMSYLSKGAYDIVVSQLDKHFSKYKGEFKKEIDSKFLIYSRIKGKGYNNIPGVTFYFKGGAKLDVNPEGTFMKKLQGGKETFRLMIRETKTGCWSIFVVVLEYAFSCVSRMNE